MKKLIIYTVFLFFITQTIPAQVLFSEDFDSYSAGHLNTDYTGTTLGQGGWLVWNGTTTGTAIITAETGKGNVLTLSSSTSQNSNAIVFYQKNIVKNLTTGNNILKLEYEFYIKSGTGHFGNYFADYFNVNASGGNASYVTSIYFRQKTNQIILNYPGGSKTLSIIPSQTYDTWVKVEMIIDYNTNYVYYYVPSLNINRGFLSSSPITNVNDIVFRSGELDSLSVVKIDNIKLSALQTLPSYILSTNEQLAAKFNLYPNPATNVVTITNNENRLVNQVAVYDTTGKLISTHSFNEQTEIQLNIENLASGTYMLHLQTNEGTAVKKLVKK